MNVLRRSARARAAERLRRSLTHSIALVAALAVTLPVLGLATATPAAAAAAPADDGALRVLLFYKANFHASNVQARQAVRDLATELGTQYGQTVDIQETDDAAAFTTTNLSTKDVVVFAQTGGVLFDAAQRAALEAYIRGGGGYMGMHYAAWSVGTSEHDVNPFYQRLVGASSEGHPENPAVRPGRVVVTDTTSPLTQGLPADFTRSDEWYDWTLNPAADVHTLLEADESSYGMSRQGSLHPITWCQEIDAGRSWYTGMGHEGTAFSETVMRTQMRSGLAYSAGLLPADCSPPSKEANGAWSDVTPWPLMPINMALTADGKVQSFGSVSSGCTDTTPFDWTGNSCITQGGQMEVDIWNPEVPRTLANLNHGIVPNTTYTDLFCSMQVQDPHRHSTLTVGGDDGLGGNAPNDAAIGVTSYSTNNGLQNEAPMNYPRWYPTGTTMPNGDIVVQGGSLRGGPGGAGVITPEIYTGDDGAGWKLLEGATSAAAYGDGGNGNGPDENRWWYPRAFVAPGNGNLFNISGTQMFELDPSANGGTGQTTLRGTLPTAVANQGGLGNPVGATSTATMYRPGKILQVGGGWWANGGGPAGARAGFTVDITGGTANPVVTATQPMKFQRHWPTSTVLPDGDVLVTGGSRDNNGDGGYVTNAEVWDPDTGEWTTIAAPYEHARLYHSAALLLPDGRVMMGGGGAPGPRNYTDVEYYSPSYLFDGDEPAVRPTVTSAPDKIGYNGTFKIATGTTVSRVTLVRNGSVTHGFNNDQNFQDLAFTQAPGSTAVTITAPVDGTYAAPGAYMLFVWDQNGTPSVASMLDINPAVAMDRRTPQVVDQFEYPRLPTEWRGANPPAVIDVAPGNGRMAPWAVDSQVQLVRAVNSTNGALGATGYHLALGASGSLERTLTDLTPGKSYRVQLRYARDSRAAAGAGDATAALAVGSLNATLTATTADPTQGGGQPSTFRTYAATFTADARTEVISLVGSGTGAGLVVDDLVVLAADPSADDVPVHYEFEEGTGTTAANTGDDTSVGSAVLTGTAGWSPNGIYGKALDLSGGTNTSAVDLPDNLLQNATDFTTSFWVRPDTKGNWINLFHIGDGLGDAGSFFQIQMQTQAAGNTGLAATFKKKGSNLQERIYATPTKDVAANAWNHVVFTRTGTTGTLYLNGVEIATRNNLTLTMTDIGPTANNWLGRNGYPDPAFDGLMDEVRVYTSSLTAADVSTLYADGTALRTTTAITVDPVSPSPFGEALTVSATVVDKAATPQPAQGTAELWLDGARVGEPVVVTAGAVTFPDLPTTLTPGDHAIEVRFLGSEGWRDSTATTTHTVTRPPVGEGVPAHYTFDEGTGTTAANTGTDPSIGAATLQGATGWTPNGQFGSALSLPGGASGTNNHVRLPDNIEAGLDDEFSVSIWARPDALPNWVSLLQIGSSTDTFFLLQSSTQANGATGFAATFKAPGNPTQERLVLGGGNDVPLNEWTHIVFTMSGSTGRIYFDGELVGSRTDFTLGIGDVGVGGNTTANFIGGTSWPDPRYDGLVDDFRMYGYELSGTEVNELFEGPQVNDAPVALADAYSTDEGDPLTVAAPGVLDNDTDADGDTLTATNASDPAHGAVMLGANGSFTYTPDAGFSGTDTFTYTASDGTVDSAPATVTITVDEVVPPNVAPVAEGDTYSTDEGDPLTVAAPGVLANDTDADGDTLTATNASDPDHGAVTLSANGSFTYTPDAGFFGTDTFTYRAEDGIDASAATVTITVVEDPPAVTSLTATAGSVTYGKAGAVDVSITPAGASGSVEVLNGSTSLGSAALSAGSARVVVPAKALRPGRYDLTVRYAGTADHAASSTTVRLVVTKVKPAMKVVAPKTIKPGVRPPVTVTLSAAGAVPVTGKVRVTVKGKSVTGTIKNGRVVLKLPVSAKAGKLTVKVAYLGSDLATAVTKTVTITVKK